MTFLAHQSGSLGADIRSLRKARGLTLTDMAENLGRSIGWMSQVERNISEPSIEELRTIAHVMNVPISIFFGQAAAKAEELGCVVRKDTRRKIGGGAIGLIEELLSPDLTDTFEMVHSTFEPGAALENFVTRATQEVGYLVSGQLRLWIGDHEFDLAAGDSFRIRSEPFKWANPYTAPAVAVWVVAPPIY